MTVHVPLDGRPCKSTASFVVQAQDSEPQLAKVAKAIAKSRRIAVVCGAGISVQAGIPDFRSPEGLFQTLKRDNPKESLTSGKDLFDASVFRQETTTSLFCQMIGRLAEMSQTAAPTPFHRLLKTLDQRGRLLRVYTQNIDGLEEKSGLSFGVPDFEDRRQRGRAKPLSQESNPPTRLPTPPADIPRCIPLHGTLQTVHCLNCNRSFPSLPHVSALRAGSLPTCRGCEALDDLRTAEGKRSRGIGRLRPSVVLYNETHKDGEGVGEAVRRDLMGSGRSSRGGADLLLVVGTSLKVPGTKRIVREFAKSLHARDAQPMAEVSTNLPTPAPSPGPSSPAARRARPIRTIYLNLDFPAPAREWEGVFDVWVDGDAQSFACTVEEEISRADILKAENVKKKQQRAHASGKVIQPKKVAAVKSRGTTSELGGAKRRKVSTASAKFAVTHSRQPSLPLTILVRGGRYVSPSPFGKNAMHAQPGPINGLVPFVDLERHGHGAEQQLAYLRGCSSDLTDLSDSECDAMSPLPHDTSHGLHGL